MKRLNIHEAKTNLSRYLSELKAGEALLVCNRNHFVAELRTLRKTVRKPRIGVAKGEFEVSESFFEPLLEEILKAFGEEWKHVGVEQDGGGGLSG